MAVVEVKIVLTADVNYTVHQRKGIFSTSTWKEWLPTAPFEVFTEVRDFETGEIKRTNIHQGYLELIDKRRGKNKEYGDAYYKMKEIDRESMRTRLMSFVAELDKMKLLVIELAEEVQKLSWPNSYWGVSIFSWNPDGPDFNINPGLIRSERITKVLQSVYNK